MPSAKYDAIAQWYDDLVETDDFTGKIIDPALWQLMDDVSGKFVCDLGCGQGRLSRALAKQGAIVTGIDLSQELIEIAQQKTIQHDIIYYVDNAETLQTIPDTRFDLVVSNLALMDIGDIEKTFASVHRILKTDGHFIFSITHPCFEAPHAEWIKQDNTISRLVHTYMNEGVWYSTNKNGVRGQVGATHRTLATYINRLIEAGFSIEQMIEPTIPQNTEHPIIGHQVIPAFMVIKCGINK